MEQQIKVDEVLFETRHHASRPFSSNYPPINPQLNQDSDESLLSWIPLPGVSHIKNKWREYRHPQRLRKLVSLFVSPSGERVAITTANQITILQKDDDFRQPCGYYNCSSNVTFTCGAWSETHDILGVCDDTDTLYFIKVNGELISSITRRHLKLSSPILDLIVLDDFDDKKSCLGVFRIFTSDASFYDIDISKDPRVSISSACTSIKGSMLNKQSPQCVFCMDYHSDFSLVALVCTGPSTTTDRKNLPEKYTIMNTCNAAPLFHNKGAVQDCGSLIVCQLHQFFSGSYSLSLWRRTGNLNLEPVCSTQFDGLYSISKGYIGLLTYPKLLFSPSGKLVATLDLRGSLVTFKVKDENCSLSIISYQENFNLDQSDKTTEGRDWLNDIVDFTWWSDNILTIVKRGGAIIMFDIFSGARLSKSDLVYSMPVLERVQQIPRHVFLLESTSRESEDPSQSKEPSSIHLMEQVIVDKFNQLDIAKLKWRLMSFAGRSVPEMYDILISGGKYQEALDFAIDHGLDQDEVLKTQWLLSGQGIKEISKLLPNIKDQAFVLSECVDRVGQTEDSTRALLAYGFRLTEQYIFSDSEDDLSRQIWDFRLTRLKVLQFRDKLETFLGINMGRFSMQDYMKFRTLPINESAVVLAESGKIGALNLLFKRHPYSLAPCMLEVLAAIPETIPVKTYGQLLPGLYPPSSISLREEDWVECEKMVASVGRFLESHENSVDIKTEPMFKQTCGLLWPSNNELTTWYKSRARAIDSLSGQLDNSLCLIDCACQKGISDLQQFREDISYLHQLIYSVGTEDETNFSMDLITWEKLPNYEKFKIMLKGVKEENVVEILQNKALPFMQFQIVLDTRATSFLVSWLKEMASDTKLELCLMVIEEGCREIGRNGFFRNEVEVVDCALQCIYSCTSTDKWNTMNAILSKLPKLQDSEVEGLKKRLELAEGHIEAGRLLTLYQVPKPIGFLIEPHEDVKGVKQILRLILSKFVRRLPGRSDNEWANMWRDLQSLQEKAFPFLDLEYILMEFCRGLLKAGKFPLARNYLKGSGSVSLAADKAEYLVIQAARDYFFSASSLACSEIWKAKECLNILPNSRNVRAEADIIDAITIKLPNLGVNLLPMQFRQIKDPMEIIKLAITSQGGSYLNVEELVEVAKLLGLSSQDDISAVQEAIAREAAVAGDLQLSFDLCLALAKKGHGAVWDLCAALARGPVLENMDVSSRKQLLGFALSHCDEESIGELLLAWKDLDIEGQCEKLMILTGTDPPKFSTHGATVISYPPHSIQDIADLRDQSGQVDRVVNDDQEVHFETIKNTLLVVAKDITIDDVPDWDSLLRDNGKMFSFVALRLPWLLELSQFTESDQNSVSGSISSKMYVNVRTQAVVAILSWLARNGFAPKDNLIASLAKSILTPPVTQREDVLGCSFLLNLVDAFHGVEIIEEQVRRREDYNEISSIMNVGMIYSLLHNCGFECEDPAQRRELLLKKFQEKYTSPSSDEQDKIDKTQSSFWREWKVKLENQKRVADHTRVLEQIIPGVETARFLSGDIGYMESVVCSFVGSVRSERKQILKDVLLLVSTYGLDETKVLQQYLASVLVSDVWTVDDIMAEISNYRGKVLACAAESIQTIALSVFPAINGHDKQRLACIYSLLSDCYMQLGEDKELLPVIDPKPSHIAAPALAHFYKVVEQECSKVSFIQGLNFKNIAGLQGLNLESFSTEVYSHIDEHTVEALAKMVQILVDFYGDPASEALISWRDVYRQHVQSLLSELGSRAESGIPFESPENLQHLINELESTYDMCRNYTSALTCPAIVEIMKQYFDIILPFKNSFNSISCNSSWQDCLRMLLTFWVKLADDMQEFVSQKGSEEEICPRCLMVCLEGFLNLVVGKKISPSQGWRTLVAYVNDGLSGSVAVKILHFCRAMIISGCKFEAIAHVYSDAVSQFPPESTSISGSQKYCDDIQDLPHLYLSVFETILQDLTSGASLDHPNLHNLLSSLSEAKDEMEDLKMVRLAVWTSMAKFSDNLDLPDHVRVYILELMQFISSRGRTLKAFSAEIQANIVPWEGWDGSQRTDTDTETTVEHGVQNVTTEASSRFANTLVALKSSQLVSAISPSLQITPKDLLTVESAVSCFSIVCEAANSGSHCDCLIDILEEWEGLFPPVRAEANTAETTDAGNNWSSDDWDDGWESFQEPLDNEVKDNTPVVHPLHACWLEIFQKLVQFSRFTDLLKLIDKSLGKTTGILLDDNGTLRMSQTAGELDCFAALKMALLLPYDRTQLLCLDSVEENLKQVGISDTISRDTEFLSLALYSGIITKIISKPSYGSTFAYLCYIVGNFSRQCQEDQLPSLKQGRVYEPESREKDILFLFRKLLFPCFISELVKADQQILAGILVTKFMHTNASLSLINVAEASLRKYLEMQQLQLLQDAASTSADMNFSEPLANTVAQLKGRLGNRIQTALSLITTNVR